MRRRLLATLLLPLALLGAACSGDDDDRGADATTTTTEADDETTSSTATTTAEGITSSTTSTTGRPSTKEVGDWDDVRFDAGIVDRIDRTEDGLTRIVFDRVQVEGKQAKDFTEEPIYAGNTDVVYQNDNTRLRTYIAAPTIEVLKLANVQETCSGNENRTDPVWTRITVDEAVNESIWRELQQVSVTFDGAGHVTRLRFSSGC